MKLYELKPDKNSRKSKQRVGRGHAAGKGKQAGKGQSGQNKRSGHRLGFEGGQNPWFRRLPKRGFKNINHLDYQVISTEKLEKNYYENQIVDSNSLYDLKIIKKRKNPIKIKILAKGKLTKKLIIKVDAISKKAREIVESAGGKVEVI